MLKINEIAPNFNATTTNGEIDFHEWIADSWVILFSHPKDFTPVCTTELGYMASVENEFKEYQFSVDNLEEFIGYRIKIVMSGTNEAQAPRFKDLRTIALA